MLPGALIAVPAAYKADDAYTGIGIAAAGVGALLVPGRFSGDAFKTMYALSRIKQEQSPGGQAEVWEYVIPPVRLNIGLVQQPGWLSHKSCGFSG